MENVPLAACLLCLAAAPYAAHTMAHNGTQWGVNFFILDSRRVLAPAPKVPGSDIKTHLKSRFCLQAILIKRGTRCKNLRFTGLHLWASSPSHRSRATSCYLSRAVDMVCVAVRVGSGKPYNSKLNSKLIIIFWVSQTSLESTSAFGRNGPVCVRARVRVCCLLPSSETWANQTSCAQAPARRRPRP